MLLAGELLWRGTAALLALALLAACSTSTHHRTARDASASSLVSQAAAHRLERGLASGRPDRLRAVLLLPGQQTLTSAFARALAALAPFRIDAAGARPLDGDLVGATATSGPPGRRTTWQLVLAPVGGDWQLAAASSSVAPPSSPPVAQRPAVRCRTTGFDGLGRAHPLLLVGGSTSTRLLAARGRLARLLGPGWRVGALTDPAVRTDEPGAATVVGCLARRLLEVARAQRAAGGDGRVYVVAQGSGGLTVRFASARARVAAALGSVVTIATPAEGSPFGNPAYLGVDLARLTTAPAGVVSLPASGSRARACLATGSVCGLPPYLPARVPFTQVGGDVTVQRSWFGVPAYDLHVDGDGVVPIPSALGYHSSGPVGVRPQDAVSTVPVRCTIDVEALLTAPRAALVQGLGQVTSGLNLMAAATQDQLTPGELQIATRALVAPCSHGYLATDPATVRAVADAVRDNAAGPHPGEG